MMEAESSVRHRPLLDDGDYSSSRRSSSQPDSFLGRIRSTHNIHVYFGILALLVGIIVIGFIAVLIRRDEEVEPSPADPDFRNDDQVASCLAARSSTRHPPNASPRIPDPSIPSLLLRNATVHDGRSPRPYLSDILLVGGVINTIAVNLPLLPSPGANIDVEGRHVTPGLVDMHSHIGVYAWPGDLWATQDGNEMTKSAPSLPPSPPPSSPSSTPHPSPPPLPLPPV